MHSWAISQTWQLTWAFFTLHVKYDRTLFVKRSSEVEDAWSLSPVPLINNVCDLFLECHYLLICFLGILVCQSKQQIKDHANSKDVWQRKAGPRWTQSCKKDYFLSLCLHHTLPNTCKNLSLVSFQTKPCGEVVTGSHNSSKDTWAALLAREQPLFSESSGKQVVAYLARWVCSGYSFCMEKATGHDAVMPLTCMTLAVRIGMLKHSRPRKYWREVFNLD